VDINQTKLKVESSKEILLQTILKNRENLDTNLITYANKDFVKNYEIYSEKKKRLLDIISEIRK
jgi:CRISPR/Cas system-associated exonuclease Cas4 (RecB family)